MNKLMKLYCIMYNYIVYLFYIIISFRLQHSHFYYIYFQTDTKKYKIFYKNKNKKINICIKENCN